MFGIGSRELGTRLGERSTGIMLEMPFACDNARKETVERLRLVDQLLVEKTRIPVVQDMTDIEDDGPGTGNGLQPWRAVKRRFVLLMT